MILWSCALAEADGCGARTSGQGRCVQVTSISKAGWQGSSAENHSQVWSNEALASLSSAFSALYALIGRPSIPAREAAAGDVLLQVFYTICSERQLMERLEFDLLFLLVRRHGR